MKKKLLALFFPFLLPLIALAAPATMRLDYYHTGDADHEVFSQDRVVIEPLPWPGNPRHMIDDTNSGKYLFEVRDRATNRMLYSRGFSSIYGEWETTEEAKHSTARSPSRCASQHPTRRYRSFSRSARTIIRSSKSGPR